MSPRVVLVGGGLANSLIALRLRTARPEVEIRLLERDTALGGNHVWSFHDGDLTAEQRDWMAPLVAKSWSSHDVRFPGLRRRLSSGYHAVTSERLHEVIMEPVGAAARFGVEVTRVEPRRVHLADGTALEGDAVIDGRGDPGGESLTVAFQKFVGLWLELERDHDLECPILMDATVEQRDGFRFIYTLPFDDRIVHVEDTRYSDSPDLDRSAFRDGIVRYVESMGWRIRDIEREEVGVLPIVLGGDIEKFWADAPGVPRSGLRAALFHPTTGYSLPEAVRLADDLVRLPDLRSESLYPWIRNRSLRLWRRGGFFRLLNRMLFRAADPDRRYAVLQRFYGLPEPLVRRFYAGQSTVADRIRILVGKPPVPVSRALKCLVDGGKSP